MESASSEITRTSWMWLTVTKIPHSGALVVPASIENNSESNKALCTTLHNHAGVLKDEVIVDSCD